MTKRRPPVSFEDAVTKIAGVLLWPEVSRILDRGERAARNLGDPDAQPAAGDGITLNQARALDAAYRRAGGTYAPMLHAYALQLEAEVAAATADCTAIAMAGAEHAKEAGEAVQATVAASLPGASELILANAERQLEEDVASATHALGLVRKRREQLLGLSPSAPEVAQPVTNGARPDG